ncbi:MAG: response regulator [Desulfomonile tiedjei]|nr:response regulator [Desulfomonile tiedjei]
MNHKIILLVEDNPDDEALTIRSLRKGNIANEVVVARDGAEALKYLFPEEPLPGGQNQAMPELVLLDLKLPKVNGLEVLKLIRADDRTRLLPVVVLTSSDEEPDLIESYKLGANSYVRKPVEFHEFADAVRQVGLYWLVLNQPPPLFRNEHE